MRHLSDLVNPCRHMLNMRHFLGCHIKVTYLDIHLPPTITAVDSEQLFILYAIDHINFHR